MDVRWDAVVVDNRFWTDPSEPAAAPPDSQKNSAPVSLKVWLYGTLAKETDWQKRPIELQFQQGFKVADVIAELVRRYGEGFKYWVVGPNGKKLRHCRVTVDGFPADNEETPIYTKSSTAVLEMILLTAIEGG